LYGLGSLGGELPIVIRKVLFSLKMSSFASIINPTTKTENKPKNDFLEFHNVLPTNVLKFY